MDQQVAIEVPDSLHGARVDKAIAELFSVSRARAAQVVAEGVFVDGVPASASDRVRVGSTIRCVPPAGEPVLEPEDVAFTVLSEDPEVIVVDKPPGIVVHPGSGRARGTLAAGLLRRYPELSGVGQRNRWGLVHRLDKDTSGVLLVARTEEAYRDLTSQLRRRAVGRSYVTLVEGRMDAPTGAIEAPIGRDPAHPTRRSVSQTGKPARTRFEVTRYYPEDDVSLLNVALETGRTHQIRVHMAAIEHPVVGDFTYGATRRDLNAPRTLLHASRVDFHHPGSGEPMTVEAPLPDDLAGFLANLS